MNRMSFPMSAAYYDLESLRSAIRDGARPEYLFFWGHTRRGGRIGNECLSQWYPAPFEADGRVFPTAEHYMMVHKALLFGDRDAAERILQAPTPKRAKELGRQVSGFAEEIWDANRFAVVVNGNVAKFSQTPSLRAFLLGTRPRVIVEASPTDRIWGIGLAADSEHVTDPARWRGLNLLGFALMVVRDRLEAEATRRRAVESSHDTFRTS